MPYNSVTSRTDAAALIPEDVAREIIQGVEEQSVFLRNARRLRNMTRAEQRMPVLGSLPTVYMVEGDSGLIQTTEMAWSNKYINAATAAAIIPIPRTVLDDADYDLWSEYKPKLMEAFALNIDRLTHVGLDLQGNAAPTDWPDDLKTAAVAASNNLALGGVGPDLYGDIMGEGGLISKLEDDGFIPNAFLGSINMRGKLRGVRDSEGQPIMRQGMNAATQYVLDGAPIYFPRDANLQSSVSGVYLFAVDYSQFVYSFRQDIEWDVSKDAVITDAGGNIVRNLWQQNEVGLRAIMRLGWQCPNPINRLQQTEASRYPAAVLTT